MKELGGRNAHSYCQERKYYTFLKVGKFFYLESNLISHKIPCPSNNEL